MVPSLPLLSCELSVSVKENPDRKKKEKKNFYFKKFLQMSKLEEGCVICPLILFGVFHRACGYFLFLRTRLGGREGAR